MTWFQIPIARPGAAVRLLCLPYAGAGASAYAGWAAAFGAAVEVRPVQLPGRESRILEDPTVDPDALAAAVAAAASGGYALFGHSLGARLAFEVVRRLRAAGARLPEALFVSACRAPDVVTAGPFDGLSLVDDDELVARLRTRGGLPAEVAAEPELLELVLPALRADFAWLDGYVYAEDAPLPVPIVGFAGADDAAVPLDQMRDWQRHTTAGFALHVLPGGHFFPRHQLPELAALIEGRLVAPHRVALGRWSVWRDAILRTTGFPARGLDRFAAPACAAAADAWLGGTGAGAAFERAFADAVAAGRDEVRALATDPRFREAVTWQNPGMVSTLDALAVGKRYRPSVARHREATVVRYWQRYCAKNETIGFFGPVCWALVDNVLPDVVVARPGPALVRDRRVFLEAWAVRAYAEALAADPAVRRCLCPRPQPHVAVDGRHALDPPRPPQPLSPVERAALAACDGTRPAAEVVAGLGLPRADDGYLLLTRLVERGLLRWDFDIPSDPTAESVLAARIAAIADPAARAVAAGGLRRLRDARDAVAGAAGRPAALRTALAALDRVFTEVTGRAPHRAAGQHYAGRRLCYEDTLRDLDVRFGAGLLDALAAPLDLMLRAARWLCAELADVHAAALRELYDDLAASGSTVYLGELWFLAQGLFFGDGDRPADAAVAAFRKRWETVLRLADDGGARLDLSAARLAGPVAELFPDRGPGWSAGRLHSPDLLLCAASAEDLNRGAFTAVLGELHVAWPTFDNALFVGFHPDPDALVRALAADLGPGRMRLLYPPDWPRGAGRLAPVLAGPTDAQLGFAAAPGADRNRLAPAAALVVRPDPDAARGTSGGELAAHAPDGRRWPLLEVFGALLATRAVDAFEVLGGRPHSPRVTVDRLVVARETWRTTVAATGLADVTGDRERFLAARRWRHRLGLPERVFVRAGTETKPTYVDFRGPLYVRALSTALRAAAATAGGGCEVTVTEMLPAPDQAWVVDGAGERYLSELRIQVSDG
ncbi:thioesterase domain-containing protein [Actinomycetes bacterium KLBMP 9797]